MRLWNKLASRRGETLTETLVAVLMVALASVLLASMLSSASRMNAAAMEKDEALYDAVTAAETGGGSGETGTVRVTLGGAALPDFNVTYYSDAGGTLYAYGRSG